MESKEKELASGTGQEGCPATYRPDSLMPLMAGMFYGMRCDDGQPSRRHDFQQLLFALLKSCADADAAREVMQDMQEAVTSTVNMIDQMAW